MATAGERQALRVHNLAMSLDGYIAGPDQTSEHPMGPPCAAPARSEPRPSGRGLTPGPAQQFSWKETVGPVPPPSGSSRVIASPLSVEPSTTIASCSPDTS